MSRLVGTQVLSSIFPPCVFHSDRAYFLYRLRVFISVLSEVKTTLCDMRVDGIGVDTGGWGS